MTDVAATRIDEIMKLVNEGYVRVYRNDIDSWSFKTALKRLDVRPVIALTGVMITASKRVDYFEETWMLLRDLQATQALAQLLLEENGKFTPEVMD